MNETKEIILNSIGVLCREYPEQRFGQILYNYLLSHCNDNDTFYMNDQIQYQLPINIINNTTIKAQYHSTDTTKYKNTTTNKQIDNNIDKRTNLINGKNNKRSLH